MFCVEEHKWGYFTRVYIGALIPRVYIIYKCAGDASSPGGDASPRRYCQVGVRSPNLAMRKCIVFACQGIEPCQANADAGTRRPQVRTRFPQVRMRFLLAMKKNNDRLTKKINDRLMMINVQKKDSRSEPSYYPKHYSFYVSISL